VKYNLHGKDNCLKPAGQRGRSVGEKKLRLPGTEGTELVPVRKGTTEFIKKEESFTGFGEFLAILPGRSPYEAPNAFSPVPRFHNITLCGSHLQPGSGWDQ
jgi:hypothetical protein